MVSLVSIIIPSHNRPHLLPESIESVVRQSYPNWEILVVDDGSQPPINEKTLKSEVGAKIRVLRNEKPLGLARARYHGAQSAKGEIIVHLDDDDLLAPETLEKGVGILKEDSSVDVIFLKVRGFGRNSGYFNEIQSRGVETVIESAKGYEVATDQIYFSGDLFYALLKSVPSTFQHYMMRKSVWDFVSALRLRAYCLDPQIRDIEDALFYLVGPRRDSEWALYAASVCKTVLLNQPMYLARCEGQGQFSKPSQRERQQEASISIKRHLYLASCEMDELKKWRNHVLENLSDTYFTAAYYYFYNSNRWTSWSALAKAMKVKPCFNYMRFFARTLFPREIPGIRSE